MDDSGLLSATMNLVLLGDSVFGLSLSMTTPAFPWNQWYFVCGPDPAPSDEPTSLGVSAEGFLRRAIVPTHTLAQSLH